jgi:hypothetical protein
MLHLVLGGMGEERAGALLGLIIVVIDVNDRDGLVPEESVGSLVEHTGDVVAHNRLSLHMQVSHHSVTIPVAHHVYVVHVDSPIKECHGATGPQGPSTYARCLYVSEMNVETRGVTEYICHVFCFDKCPSRSMKVCDQRRIGP